MGVVSFLASRRTGQSGRVSGKLARPRDRNLADEQIIQCNSPSWSIKRVKAQRSHGFRIVSQL
jgi:hypothetical protein